MIQDALKQQVIVGMGDGEMGDGGMGDGGMGDGEVSDYGSGN